MRVPVIVSLCVSLLSATAFGADDGAPVSPLQPYDAPSPTEPAPPAVAAPAAPAPALAKPVRSGSAADNEVPDSEPLPQLATAPTRSTGEPSEAGLVAGETLLAFLTFELSIAAAANTSPYLLFATPLVAGITVCGIGQASDAYDGSCGAAIGGAYAGALTALPLALLFSIGDHSGNSEDAWIPMWAVGAALGLILGPPIGAVIGWNASRELKPHLHADAAHLDALAAARAAPWREPLLARGSLREGAGPRVAAAPLLAFRF
jgi:hypothetical protein